MSSEIFKNRQNTDFPIKPYPFADINSRIFFIGSCFSENIFNNLKNTGFECLNNPYGILFNPYSIALSLEKIASEYRYSAHDFTYHAGEFHSMHHHGSFRHKNAEILANQINRNIETAHEFLTKTDIAIITPGTAKVWQMRQPEMIVGNCHKIPDHEFTSRHLTETEIGKAYRDCIYYLRMINPKIRIMFTISPVKHLRDGIQENVISKSRLISALASLREEHEDILYFPSYEIQTEELRDHRYYTEDLAHPTAWATEYIFKRFCEACFTESARHYIEETRAWLRMKNHRVMSQDPHEAEEWKKKCSEALAKLKASFPAKETWPGEWI
ncbi:MAG: GSCFA domain-containing protein [Sphingomonadales bacterium]|jgi:hypothetical protein